MRHFNWLLRRDRILSLKLHPKKRQRLNRIAVSLFFVTLGLVTFLTLGLQAEKAKALEIGDKITRENWRGTSFPVENFQRYSSAYGYRWHPDGASGWGFHRGLDLAAPNGSYIRSWADGQVTEISNDRLCGTKIVIRSGKWEHIYCHLKGRAAKSSEGDYLSDRNGEIELVEGQYIKAGTRIGRVGMTGRTTGPHLHWGLKYDCTYIYPALVLHAMYRQQSSY